MQHFNCVCELGGMRSGCTHNLAHKDGLPDLEHWIIWFGYTKRLLELVP